MKKVLLIGTIPPPVGGVSMHIQRFFDKYKNHQEWFVDVLDLKRKYRLRDKQVLSLWQIIKVIYSASIIHIHLSSNLKIFVAIFAKILRKKVIYTHHNIRIKNHFLFKVLMFFVDELILVNDKDISSEVKKYNYQLIPAFLPSTDDSPLPLELEKKLSRFENILSTNCFHMTFINNKDLYGFDLCVHAFIELVNNGNLEKAVLVLVDPSNTSKKYVDELTKNFKSKNSCEILYVGYSINFNTLIKMSKGVLRATRSDGDSLTVREALWIGTPIIASDVTLRPKGTIYFKNEERKDLEEKMLQVINKESGSKKSEEEIDYGELIIKTYDSTVSNNIL